MDQEARKPASPAAEQSHDKPLRSAVDYESPEPPRPNDYPNPYDPVREQQRAAQAATSRRLEREEAFVNSGLVAGHDFKREHAERERER